MRERTARGLLAEGLVVVTSILIAFGLEAWWGGWEARRDLLDDVANVREELESNREVLRFHLLLQRTAVASVADLMHRIEVEPGDWLTLPDTIVLSATLFTPTFDPSTGAMDALISAGGLSQLRNSELKGILTGFRTEVEDIREDELGARRAAHESILPLLWDDDAIAPVMERVNDFYSRGFDPVPLSTTPIRIPNTPGLLGRLALRRGWLLSAVRELEILEARLELASQLLQGELGVDR